MPETSSSTPHCLVCDQTSDQVPLLTLTYLGGDLHICAQHLPILIHNPAQLAGKLPGAERLPRAQGH